MIDEVTYKLPDINYIQSETVKKQIVMAHTYTNNMRHYVKWTNRLVGKYKKTAPFTISFDGTIYSHFDPLNSSFFFGNSELDRKSIVILLENEGWLVKNGEKNEFINWVGHIYNRPEEIVEKRWRGYTHWAPYTKQQMDSAIKLVNSLCEEFYIEKFVMPHNTKVETLDNFKGVMYRSNLEKHYTDLSPAWNFEEFKYKLENYEK